MTTKQRREFWIKPDVISQLERVGRDYCTNVYLCSYTDITYDFSDWHNVVEITNEETVHNKADVEDLVEALKIISNYTTHHDYAHEMQAWADRALERWEGE